MAGKGLMRTDYWNRVTGSVRIGDTRRDETVTDVEGFLLPYAQAGTVGLHLWGIAAGLSVTATADQPGLSVAAGSAIDAAGHLIVVSGGGVAVVDPDIDPADVTHIPTVAVDTTGVILPTAADTGPRYLTVRYLEVSVEGLLGNSPALVHAPWLRLRDTTGFSDDGTDVVLARVTLDNGIVTALSGELRRLAGLPAGRLQLRRPITGTGAALTIDDVPAGELRAHPDGALDLTMLDTAGTPTRTALTLDPSGNIGIGATQPRRPLHVEGSEVHSGGPGGGFSFADRAVTSLVESPQNGERWRWYAEDGTARLWSGTDRLSVAANGNIGIGIGDQQARRTLHVEGSEIHSGGGVAGFSFADRTTGSFVETPTAGQRWVWYAQDGTARLWSGVDRLVVSAAGEGGGLDVARRMRVRQGNGGSAGIWLFQTGPQNDRAFVGMADDTQIGFWGNTGAGWGVTMDTTSGQLNANRGLNVTGGGGAFQPAIKATGNIGVQAEGPIALFASSQTSWAGLFGGDVRVTGTLNKGGSNFEIDHPLDPANKFLHHSGIESDEMKNLYDGVAQLDSDGRAEVVLPDWFEALNENFRYQLTPIGASAPDLHIADELHDGRFSIAGGRPDSTVCWQVSGVRHDAYAKAHPLRVELEKSHDEAGLFLHPEAHDAPAERSLATLVTKPAD